MEFRRNIASKSLSNPVFTSADVSLDSFAACDKKISIEILNDFHVVYHRHKGSYGSLSQHWGIFQEKYGAYITGQTLFFERTYDDPSITDTDECLYDIYMTVPPNCGLKNTCTLQGSKFAVYHFKGPVHQIYAAYQSIFNVWLPQSGHVIDERYGFDIYRAVDCDAMRMVLIAGAAVFGLVLAGAGWYGGLFVQNDAVAQMVRLGVAVFGLSFLFSGINVITSFYFTSIGKAMESAVISCARGLVILLICIFLFPPLLGMTGVWLVAPVTEGLTLLLNFVFIRRDNLKRLCPPEKADA